MAFLRNHTKLIAKIAHTKKSLDKEALVRIKNVLNSPYTITGDRNLPISINWKAPISPVPVFQVLHSLGQASRC